MVTLHNSASTLRMRQERIDHSLLHAHSHITRAVAAMDSCFALVGAHQHGIANGSMKSVPKDGRRNLV